MADPCKRIAAWLFAAALLITVVGCTYPVLTAPAHTSRPQTTAANTSAISAVKPPRYQEAAIAVVVATPTPEPTPEPTAVPTVAYVPPAPVYSGSSSDFEALLHAATTAAWGEGEWAAMRQLILNESGMNPYAVNASSGACSAFQFLPCSKLGAPMSDFANQVSKGIDYIRARYNSPSQALSYWYCTGRCTNNYGTITKTSHWY